MCLAIPGKVIETFDQAGMLMGKVQFGGIVREACLEYVPETQVGEYVLVHVGFATLGLQTFLTAGPKEARAWTIHIGDTAPKAAGVIHTDFEKGFIKAEVVSYDDLLEMRSVVAARAAGRARMEGKDYVMRDGDVVEFRFNN